MNCEEITNNRVTLTGIITKEPTFSHEVYGEGFYEFILSVPRLSEQHDLLPITISERLLNDTDMGLGCAVTVVGQFRSYNKIEDNKSKLMLTVFARSIGPARDDINPNTVELNGYICKPPMYRITPFKREISDVLIAVNRAYSKSDYIPCIAWGRNARFVNTLTVGDHIQIIGRIQSREYQKACEGDIIETRTAYEVSIAGMKSETGKQDRTPLKNII